MRKVLYLIGLILLPFAVHAQTSVALSPVPAQQFFSQTGVPLASGCVFTYTTGTSTPLATYTDGTGTAQNTNPVILDSGGFGNIWLTNASYRFSIYSAGGINCVTGTFQRTVDKVSAYTILNQAQNIFLLGATSDSAGSAGEIAYRTDLPCFRGFTSLWDCFVTLTATQTLTNKALTAPTVSGGTFSGNPSFSGAPIAAKFNSVVWLDGTTNTTLATCYAAISASGGVCEVPPNYTETLAANLVLGKSYAGFHFNGPATITMGTFQVTKAGGINGEFIKGPATPGVTQPATAMVHFIYTGTSNAFSMGDNITDTKGLDIENIEIDTGGGGANAVGLYITRTQNFILANVMNYCGSTNQVGTIFDGTGNFTGIADVTNPYTIACFSGLRFTGTGSGGTNNVVVHGGSLASTAATGRALDFQNANGNTVTGIDIEGAPTAVNFAASATVTHNIVYIWANLNTTDGSFGAGSADNALLTLFGQPLTASDSGTRNKYGRPGVEIASGTATMTTAAIATLTCGTVVTVAATNVLATDAITWSFVGSPIGQPQSNLVVQSWPTANNVNFVYCNDTAGSLTPTSTNGTLNWRVTR